MSSIYVFFVFIYANLALPALCTSTSKCPFVNHLDSKHLPQLIKPNKTHKNKNEQTKKQQFSHNFTDIKLKFGVFVVKSHLLYSESIDYLYL